MAIPQPSFGPNGFITPSEVDILAAVKAEINAAFGNVLNMADETPQGQLAVSQTAAIGNANDSFVFLSQQFDPAYNIGRYQDAVARIYFIERISATPTIVTVTCIGLAGVSIPANSLVLAADGNQYSAISGGTIPATGSIDLQFQCTVLGPIECPAGSITTIYQAVNGWDSATNSADGVIGRNTETRNEFEQRRALSVAHNSQGSLPSILGAVLTTSGVSDAFVTENVNNSPQAIRGYTLAANSVYVAAVGGTDADVAHALWTKKSPGCGYNGNTVVIVQDTNSAYTPPLPSYQVSFQRPASVTVTFLITLTNNVGIPSNALTIIQAAIISAFIGADGGPRARIGSTIFASRYYGAITSLGSWAQLVNIKIGCSTAPSSIFVGSISGSTLTITTVTSGSVAVGQQVTGNGVVPGTTIVSGSGLSWTLSTVQVVGSGTMQGVMSVFDELFINIDQVPVTSSGNINLALI